MGTSGARACVINDQTETVFKKQIPAAVVQSTATGHVEQNPNDWWQQVSELISGIPVNIRNEIQAIAVDGTSGTILLCDEQGQPTSPALMYNDSRATRQAEKIGRIAPSETGAQGVSSSLAKLLWLLAHDFTGSHALHQADWIAGNLYQQWCFSDENNALKLGYDPVTRSWPEWMAKLHLPQKLLPQVLPPGSRIGNIDSTVAQKFGLPMSANIISGTTDSIAGFLATGASHSGDAVTSLGSTLVIKLISDKPVYSANYGIYSHRLGDQWLVGGASNSGGAALKKYFNQQEMDALTPQLKPQHPTELNYYPLPGTGERFPFNDPNMKAKINPVADRLKFFQGLLESIARIEKMGYEKLSELGCKYPERIFTTGGGAKNSAWREIRSSVLQRPVLIPEQTDAAFGSALLARRGFYG
ncbi:MAG TPA: carbohydrate kinase [Chromatiales bacterium]|nr:carbohydrate kinase [Chromatiales bacterium]